MSRDYLVHHGILGQKWGVRRYQNPDGSLTEAGKRRYASEFERGGSGSYKHNEKLLRKNKKLYSSLQDTANEYKKAELNYLSVNNQMKKQAGVENDYDLERDPKKYESVIKAFSKPLGDAQAATASIRDKVREQYFGTYLDDDEIRYANMIISNMLMKYK